MPTIQSNENKELLIRIAEGDEEAFTQLFNDYLGRLRSFVEKFTNSRDDAREIIQETFIQLWLHRDKLPEVSNLPSYIFKIAANQYHMSIRKALVREKTIVQYQKTVKLSGNNVEANSRLNELQRLVQEAVQQLPPQRRIIFQMSRNKGMTIQEIALELNLSAKTVKNTLFTALGNIREYLSSVGEQWLYCLICYFLWC